MLACSGTIKAPHSEQRPLVQLAQRFSLALAQPLQLLEVELAQALGILAREVLVLGGARLLSKVICNPCNYFWPAVLAGPICSSSALARSCGREPKDFLEVCAGGGVVLRGEVSDR